MAESKSISNGTSNEKYPNRTNNNGRSVSGSRASRVGSRASRASGISSVSLASNADDGSFAHSFATGSRRSFGGRRPGFHGNESYKSRSRSRSGSTRRDRMEDAENGSGSFAGSRLPSGGLSLGGDRSIRVRATTDASIGAAAAPLDQSLRVMSVVVEGSGIAFCCYNEDQNEISTETCTSTGYETEALVERFLQVTRPNMVLVG